MKYKPYTFEGDIKFCYRYKKAKKQNRPLAVVLCGSETVGNDNLKPLPSSLRVIGKLRKYDENILIPQQPKGADIDLYVKSLKQLLEGLNGIDKKRIYLIGISLGGFCTWRSIYHFPDFYAAGIAVTGGYRETPMPEHHDFRRYCSTPLWIVHSENDKIVNIEMDDYASKELNRLGAPFKYSRFRHFGHGISTLFLLKEPWEKWLNGQNK